MHCFLPAAKEHPRVDVATVLGKVYRGQGDSRRGDARSHEAGQTRRDDCRRHRRFGIGRRRCADDTLFGIMSMTKPISATALMILVDEGKVSIDDPVEKYIPAFANAKTTSGEAVRGLKIRHLLTHTSGLGGDQGCHGFARSDGERARRAAVRLSAGRALAIRPEHQRRRPHRRDRLGAVVR